MSRDQTNNLEITAAEFPACLSVVVPVYDEAATLAEVVGKLLKVPCLLEIIIVDDCSTDGTADVARTLLRNIPKCASCDINVIPEKPQR
jgi:glycosyltransferase involved in cell wall biosynthesis